MGQALTILLEFLVLIGFALIYYLFQRRRILKRDKAEIKEIIDDFVEANNQLTEVKAYLEDLQQASNDQNYPRLLELSQSPDTKLPQDAQDFLKDLDDRISFHVRKK